MEAKLETKRVMVPKTVEEVTLTLTVEEAQDLRDLLGSLNMTHVQQALEEANLAHREKSVRFTMDVLHINLHSLGFRPLYKHNKGDE